MFNPIFDEISGALVVVNTLAKWVLKTLIELIWLIVWLLIMQEHLQLIYPMEVDQIMSVEDIFFREFRYEQFDKEPGTKSVVVLSCSCVVKTLDDFFLEKKDLNSVIDLISEEESVS